MHEDLEALLILQDRDQKIKALQNQQKSLPRERKALEDKLATAKTLLDHAKQRVKENEVERRKLQLEVEAKRTAINKFKTQQQQTRKNEEFQAFNNEIKHFGTDIQTLEDRELVFMEEAEMLNHTMASVEKEFAKTNVVIREQITRLEAGAVASNARLQDLEADHAKLVQGIPEEVAALYQRLFVKKGDAAVVPLEHEVCGGCRLKVPTQTVADVRGGQKIVQCPQCGRILYRVI